MRPSRCLSLSAVALMAAAGCSGGTSGDPDNRGDFVVNQITTGQSQVYPYRVLELDPAGVPTSTILNIESVETLQANVNANNSVLPVGLLPETAELPNGDPGNHFLLFKFSHKLRIDSILSPALSNAQTNSGLTTAISLLAYDPTTEQTTVLRGRGFVGGYTYFNQNGALELVQAVVEEDGRLVVADPRAAGFPAGFNQDVDLVSSKSFVFVADSDNDLTTLETFDPQAQHLLLRIIVSNSVRSSEDAILSHEVCTATTVGSDPNPADVIGWASGGPVRISPGNGMGNVDPLTDVFVSFNKPVQPADVGTFFSETNLTPAFGGVALAVTAGAANYTILYYADPLGPSDLCNYRVRPAYSLPGNELITVQVQSNSIRAVKDPTTLGRDIATTFRTGNGPGIVNAPVAPDAIYVGIGGADPGLSIIDLNGFGQGTNGLEPDAQGNPTKDPLDTYFALHNPNIGQPGMTPPLSPGSSTLDAGSNGPLTLVEDTRGNTKLLQSPTISQIGDIHVGAPLDIVFNNNNINVNTNGANQVNPGTQLPQPGNCVAVSTHPNPPRLVYPPPNPSRGIFAEEPTTAGGQNLLTSGTVPEFRDRAFTGFFGPAPAPPSPPPPPQFLPYSSRQQIGHFLYVLDRSNRQILVLNSNRMTILDRIRLSDPYRIAFSPSLGVMAVSNFSSGTVSIVDTDPRSATLHQVVSETRVADGPTEIVWQPDGESICVVCTVGNNLAILNGSDFSVQKVVSGNILDPIGLVVTERYVTTGNTSNVYYAYVLNGNGTVAIYESGPDGTNGIGFNDMIGLVQPVFRRARAIKFDWTSGFGGFWVSHIDDSGVATVSRCELTTSPQGQQPIQQNSGSFLLPPTFRQKEWTITESYGGADPNQPINLRFSGNSVADFVFDDMFNQGAGVNQLTQYNSSLGQSVLGHSAKGAVMNGIRPVRPAYLFVALGDVGKIDVIDVVARIRVTTIDVPGVAMLANYWRQ